MPSPIDEIFEGAIQLAETPLPVERSESLQPATVANVGELGSGGDVPAKPRLHDPEIAMLLDPDLMEPDEVEPPPTTFPVRVTQVGGSAGDGNNPCTFTYNVWDVFEEVLGNSINVPMTPEKRRPLVGERSAPNARTFGLGFFDEDDNFILYDANEVEAVELCIE